MKFSFAPILIFFIIVLIQIFLVPKIKINKYLAQTQWQDAEIRAEQLILKSKDSSAIDLVFLGSSLTNSLNKSNLTKNYTDLSFAGGSSLTGMKLLLDNHIYPKTIWVEINILKEVDIKFINRLTWKSRYANFMFESYNPFTVIFSLLGSPSKIKEVSVNKKSYIESLRRKKLEYNNVEICLVLKDVAVNLLNLEKYAIDFKNHGTNVKFIEIPTSHEIAFSNCQKRYESLFNMNKTLREFQKVKNPDELYNTSDGQHLTELDSTRFLGKVINEFY